MEALSIQPVKADYRPARTQAQSGFGDIFQAMLRDSAEQSERLDLPTRTEDRPQQDAPRRISADERFDVPGDNRRDQPYERDNDDRAEDVSGAGESRQALRDDDATLASSRSDAPDHPSEPNTQEAAPARGDGTPAPGSVQGSEEQIADVRATAPEPALSNAAQPPVAPNGGIGGQVSQTNVAAALTGANDASGKAAGVPTTATPAANQTQSPASSQPSAPAAPGSAGSNGVSVQVTVTPGQVVATPNANLGGGATSAALSAASNPDLATPATPNTEPAKRATQSAVTAPSPASNSQSPSGADRPTTAATNAQIAQVASTDGQAAAAQPTGTSAAPKRSASPAETLVRNGDPSSSGIVTTDKSDAPVRNGLAGTTPSASTQGISGSSTQDVTGQTDGAKTTNTQTQLAQTAPLGQADQAPKAAATANPQAAATQGTQAEFTSALAQASEAGEPGSRGGSAGSTDVSANRASGVPTGGFSQTAVRGPDTLGSLTQSSGTHPTPSSQAAVEIQKAVNAGKDHIRVRLNPAELGQIDVSLKVRHDGTVKVVVTTDRPETFDLMQRDARGLERALQDAGLKTDSGSLSFNLRGGDQHGPNDGQPGSGVAAQSGSESEQKADSPPPEIDQTAQFVSNRALDIHV